jgi:hypothetical protein
MFDVIPTFADIVVALILFAVKLDRILAVVIFVVMFAYGASWRPCGPFVHALKLVQWRLAFS